MSSSVPDTASGSALGPANERPLNDQEFQLLQRLLSDPFSFPAAFKAWLVSYLETSDMNLPISAVNGLTGILGIAGLGGGTLGIFPAGIILPYGGGGAPSGSKLCDGASYDKTIESRLFTAIGYAFGGAPGGPNFNVPDMRGRVPVGVGQHADVSTVGQADGTPLANRRPKHRHTVNDPTHAHAFDSIAGNVGPPYGAIDAYRSGSDPPLVASGPIHAAATGIGVGDPSDSQDAPPYAVVNFIIIS